MRPPLTTEQATRRAFEIRRLFHAGAVDPLAGLTSLDTLAAHANPKIRDLCERVALDLVRTTSADHRPTTH